jgi:hypothetical protein
MKRQTQLQWVKDRLLNDGEISRNIALQERITRLTSRINDLHNEGWITEARWVKTEYGRDYRYYLKYAPYKKVEYRVGGRVVAVKWEKLSIPQDY